MFLRGQDFFHCDSPSRQTIPTGPTTDVQSRCVLVAEI